MKTVTLINLIPYIFAIIVVTCCVVMLWNGLKNIYKVDNTIRKFSS